MSKIIYIIIFIFFCFDTAYIVAQNDSHSHASDDIHVFQNSLPSQDLQLKDGLFMPDQMTLYSGTDPGGDPSVPEIGVPVGDSLSSVILILFLYFIYKCLFNFRSSKKQ